MNITQILLGSTAAMLLIALVLSYSSMKDGEVEDGRIHSAVELREENARLQAEIDRLRSGRTIAAPVPDVEKPDTMSEEKLKAIEAQNRLLSEQLENIKKEKDLVEKEAEALNERSLGKRDKEARRARLISQAMLMAQVKEVAKDPESGIQIIVIDVKMHEQVRIGTELAIRRGTGIVGRLQVSSESEGNYFADPLPGTFPSGEIDVKEGDELIFPPL